MLRDAVAHYAFDRNRFDKLRQEFASGALDPARNRLAVPPKPLETPPVDLRDAAKSPAHQRRRELGVAALRAGKVASLVLNGGMATRFGGGAKGIVPVVEGQPTTSFLALKLADLRRTCESLGARIPAVLMHSFATESKSRDHLEDIDWAGVPLADRYWFSQSIMPRILPDGTALADLPEAESLDVNTVYAAPGHGDTLTRLRDSGTLAELKRGGVEHILVSNVDNVGSSVDPLVLGAHLEAVEAGARVSVEVVRRTPGDAGGCVAQLPDGRPAIIEGFRLPEGVDLQDYPHFNTNTLWLSTAGLEQPLELAWFAVHKRVPWPDGSQHEVVQFEQLIGQMTELVPSAFLDVDRDTRFWPIKTREDLAAGRTGLEAFARDVGLLPA